MPWRSSSTRKAAERIGERDLVFDTAVVIYVHRLLGWSYSVDQP
jgi:hypothetical protein